MRAFIVATLVAVGIVLSAGHALAQGKVVAPAAGCTATPAQLEANKKVAMAFFAPNADRVALADSTYKQHNPAFVKGGREAGLSDFEYFKSRFGGPRAGSPGGGAGRGQAPAATGPQSPARPMARPAALTGIRGTSPAPASLRLPLAAAPPCSTTRPTTCSPRRPTPATPAS